MTPGEKYILFAEDDPHVAELVLHVFDQLGHPRIVHVRDGVEALDFLHGREPQENRPAGNPTVILLDLKMPRLDGLEVVRHLKADAQFRSTPVVMLTSSHDERDIDTAYELGVNAYVVKPVEFPRLVEVLTTLVRFWMEVNQPPTRHSTLRVLAGK